VLIVSHHDTTIVPSPNPLLVLQLLKQTFHALLGDAAIDQSTQRMHVEFPGRCDGAKAQSM